MKISVSPVNGGSEVEILDKVGNVDPQLAQLSAQRWAGRRHLGRNIRPQPAYEKPVGL